MKIQACHLLNFPLLNVYLLIIEDKSINVFDSEDELGGQQPLGVLGFELDRGVLLEPQNPYPSLSVILAEKGTHF